MDDYGIKDLSRFLVIIFFGNMDTHSFEALPPNHCIDT